MSFRALKAPDLFVGGLRAQLLRGSIGSVGIRCIYVLLQFAVGVVLARALGPASLGIYAFSMAVVQLLAVAGQFGFPAFLVRGIAVAQARDSPGEIRALIVGATGLVLGLSLLIAGSAGLAVWVLGDIGRDVLDAALVTALLLVPLLALVATGSGAIRGLGHVLFGQLPDQIMRPLAFLALLIGLAVLGERLTPERALLMHAAAAALAIVMAAMLLMRLAPPETRASQTEIRHRALLRQSLPFVLLAGAQVLNHQTDVLMLGVMRPQEEVGLYRAALQVADGMNMVLIALSMTIAPHLARLHTHQDWPGLQQLLIYAHRTGAAVLLPFALGTAIFSGPLLSYVFGLPYLPAAQALAILVLGKVAYAIVGYSGLALSMFGQAGIAAMMTGATIILNVALNALLIPFFGIEGAAVGTIVSQFAVATSGVIYLYRTQRIEISAFGSRSRTE